MNHRKPAGRKAASAERGKVGSMNESEPREKREGHRIERQISMFDRSFGTIIVSFFPPHKLQTPSEEPRPMSLGLAAAVTRHLAKLPNEYNVILPFHIQSVST